MLSDQSISKRNPSEELESYSYQINNQYTRDNKKNQVLSNIINADKTLIVNKIQWNEILSNKVNSFFNNPDLFLKDIPGVIVNKSIQGPRYKDTSLKEPISHSIVGSVLNFQKSIQGKDIIKSNRKSKKKSSSSLKSMRNDLKDINNTNTNSSKKIFKGSTTQNMKLNEVNSSNQPCRLVDDDIVFKQFKKIKERINSNLSTYNDCNKKNPFELYKSRVDISDESSENNDLNESKNINNTLNSNLHNKNIVSSNTLIQSNTYQSNNVMSNTKSNNKTKSKLNNLYDNEMLKDLRRSLKKKYYGFISKVYNNRIDKSLINQKDNIPIERLTEMNKQILVFQRQEQTEKSRSVINKYISKVTNKQEESYLINKTELSKWKRTIQINSDNKKSLSDRIGENQWMVSLRKPSNFIGERFSYYNCNSNTKNVSDNERWYVVKEVFPKDPEIVIPKYEIISKDNDIKSILYTNTNDITRRGAKTTRFDLKVDDLLLLKTATNMITKKNITDEKIIGLDLNNKELINFCSQDNKRVKIIEKIAPILGNRLIGRSLLELEINNFRLLKGVKILYNYNINPTTQKEYHFNERKEEVYASDYSSYKNITSDYDSSINSQVNIFGKKLPSINFDGKEISSSHKKKLSQDISVNPSWSQFNNSKRMSLDYRN